LDRNSELTPKKFKLNKFLLIFLYFPVKKITLTMSTPAVPPKIGFFSRLTFKNSLAPAVYLMLNCLYIATILVESPTHYLPSDDFDLSHWPSLLITLSLYV
jgi:hypothetical protein